MIFLWGIFWLSPKYKGDFILEIEPDLHNLQSVTTRYYTQINLVILWLSDQEGIFFLMSGLIHCNNCHIKAPKLRAGRQITMDISFEALEIINFRKARRRQHVPHNRCSWNENIVISLRLNGRNTHSEFMWMHCKSRCTWKLWKFSNFVGIYRSHMFFLRSTILKINAEEVKTNAK